MSIRRTEREVVRPDGTVQRVATMEQSDDPDDAERLGARFEELLDDDERRTADEKADQKTVAWMLGRDAAQRPVTPSSGLPSPARMSEMGRRPEGPSARERTEEHDQSDADQQADASAQAGARDSAHAKGHKGGDREGGQGSGGDGSRDASAALQAMQSEPAPPPTAPTAPAAERAPEPRAARAISEIAGQVAAGISTSRGHGTSQVRIDLREDVLPGTSLTVEDQSGTVVVTVDSGSEEATSLLSSHAEELGRAIGRRTGRATRVTIGGQTWSTGGSEGDAAPDG
jgi:hypothetical protein